MSWRRLASVEREGPSCAVVDDLGDGVLLSLDHVRAAGDFDGFGDAADLQRHVELDMIIDLQFDAGLREGLESGRRGFQAVFADGQVRQNVAALRVGGRRVRNPAPDSIIFTVALATALPMGSVTWPVASATATAWAERLTAHKTQCA